MERRMQSLIEFYKKSDRQLHALSEAEGEGTHESWVSIAQSNERNADVPLVKDGNISIDSSLVKLFGASYCVMADVDVKSKEDVVSSQLEVSPMLFYIKNEPQCVALYKWQTQGKRVKVFAKTISTTGNNQKPRDDSETTLVSGFVVHLARRGELLEVGVAFDFLAKEKKIISRPGMAETAGPKSGTYAVQVCVKDSTTKLTGIK